MAANTKNTKSSTFDSHNDSGSLPIIKGNNGGEIEGVRFTLFPKLAPELRNKIWKAACFEPRHIDLWIQDISEDYQIIDNMDNRIGSFLSESDTCTYRSYTRTPAVLHTCSESRHIGSKHYSLPFGVDCGVSCGRATINVSITAWIYVNWECDIVYPLHFCKDYMVKDLAIRAAPLKHLALPIYHTNQYKQVVQLLNPKQVILYCDDTHAAREDYYAYKKLGIKVIAKEKVLGDKEVHVGGSRNAISTMDGVVAYKHNIQYMQELLSKAGKCPSIALAVLDFGSEYR